MLKTVFLTALFILITMPVAGEYYQYEDSQGNQRFTDDIANIPENERMDIKAYESIENNSFQMLLETNSPPVSSSGQGEDSSLSSTDTGDDATLSTRKALDAMRAKLDQTALSLKAQHEELEAQAPDKDASQYDKNAYYEKVDVLNAKMDDYKKQHQAYNEKVRAYNASNQREEKKEDDQPAK